MKQIIIKDTKNADSRTSDGELTMETLREATETHISEVGMCMDAIADEIHEAGARHDWTKLDKFEEEFAPSVLSGRSDDDFRQGDWYQRHIFTERHHIGADAKADVNLIDVIEHICDVVAAGKGRAGHISSMYCDIDEKLLYRAYWNTIRLLDDNTVLENEVKNDFSEKNRVMNLLNEIEGAMNEYKSENNDNEATQGFLLAIDYAKKRIEKDDY